MKYRCPCGAYRHIDGYFKDPMCPECGKRRSAFELIEPAFKSRTKKTADPDRLIDGHFCILPGEEVEVALQAVINPSLGKVAQTWPIDKARDLLVDFEEHHLNPLQGKALVEEKLNSGRAIVTRHDDEVMRAQVSAFCAGEPWDPDSCVLSPNDAKVYMNNMTHEEAARLLEEYLQASEPSICANDRWVAAAWALVAYARYGRTEEPVPSRFGGQGTSWQGYVDEIRRTAAGVGVKSGWVINIVRELVAMVKELKRDGKDRPKKLQGPIEREMFGEPPEYMKRFLQGGELRVPTLFDDETIRELEEWRRNPAVKVEVIDNGSVSDHERHIREHAMYQRYIAGLLPNEEERLALEDLDKALERLTGRNITDGIQVETEAMENLPDKAEK